MNNMERKVVAIVQARMGSVRFPGKSLALLNGFRLIDWICRRTKQAKLVDELVVATPDGPKDYSLAQHLEKEQVTVFRGSEDDVLSRMYEAARNANATHIVRICADNPLIDSAEIDHLIDFYFDNACDYAYNHIPRKNNYPDGLGAEIVSFETFGYIHNKASEEAHREHCMSYIWDNPENFTIGTFDPIDPQLHRPELKFDIDTTKDFSSVSGFIKSAYPSDPISPEKVFIKKIIAKIDANLS